MMTHSIYLSIFLAIKSEYQTSENIKNTESITKQENGIVSTVLLPKPNDQGPRGI